MSAFFNDPTSPYSDRYDPLAPKPKPKYVNGNYLTGRRVYGASPNDYFFNQHPELRANYSGLEASDNTSRISAQHQLIKSPEYQSFLGESRQRVADGIKTQQQALFGRVLDQPPNNPLNSLPTAPQDNRLPSAKTPEQQAWRDSHPEWAQYENNYNKMIESREHFRKMLSPRLRPNPFGGQ